LIGLKEKLNNGEIVMDDLNALMKSKYKMKTFTHTPLPSDIIPEVYTETINKNRFYVTPEGNKYPSITTVLSGRAKEGINAWRERVGETAANKIMRAASSRGTAVHELAENYLNNDELKNQEVLPLFMFTQLKPELDNINNIVMQEGGLYSDKWGIAGRVDCIAEYDGKLTVIDFKTSTKEKKEEWIENYFIQCTAYCEMYEERYGKAIDQIAILIVCEDGTTQTFVKDKKDYVPLLQPAIDEFWSEQDSQPNSH
jgi:genome maintenance exonuclease 1